MGRVASPSPGHAPSSGAQGVGNAGSLLPYAANITWPRSTRRPDMVLTHLAPALPPSRASLSFPSHLPVRESVTQDFPGVPELQDPHPSHPLVQLRSGVSPPQLLVPSVSTRDLSTEAIGPAKPAGMKNLSKCPVRLLMTSLCTECLFNSSA